MIILINYQNLKKIILPYKSCLKFNNEVAIELIKNLKFINALQVEFSVNDMLSNDLQKLASDIQKECWKRETLVTRGAVFRNDYFDEKLKAKMINNYNKTIKSSNQKTKNKTINEYFKNKTELNEYNNWKQNYFQNINENIYILILMKKKQLCFKFL